MDPKTQSNENKNCGFSLLPEEQKLMVKKEDDVMTQTNNKEITELTNPFNQEQSILFTGNEEPSTFIRHRGRKKGQRLTDDPDLCEILTRNQNIVLDVDKPKEE